MRYTTYLCIVILIMRYVNLIIIDKRIELQIHRLKLIVTTLGQVVNT